MLNEILLSEWPVLTGLIGRHFGGLTKAEE